VLVAVGKPKFLHADMVKPGAAGDRTHRDHSGDRTKRRDDDRRRCGTPTT
jgi:5,10-methylene-tetrahydrofolate dehydrogenase/methenyl tetrahydrofolate cyclohydrolase